MHTGANNIAATCLATLWVIRVLQTALINTQTYRPERLAQTQLHLTLYSGRNNHTLRCPSDFFLTDVASGLLFTAKYKFYYKFVIIVHFYLAAWDNAQWVEMDLLYRFV